MNNKVINVDPITLESQPYRPLDLNLLSPAEINAIFDPNKDHIECALISSNLQLLNIVSDLTNYKLLPSANSNFSTSNIELDPENDALTSFGTDTSKGGEFYLIYNFLQNLYDSSDANRHFFIKEILPKRKEIKIASTIYQDLSFIYDSYKNLSDNSTDHIDLYLNFSSNNLIIVNNVTITDNKAELVIHLYEPLPPVRKYSLPEQGPSNYVEKDKFWIVSQVADPVAFSVTLVTDNNINISEEDLTLNVSNVTLKGPNVNLNIKDRLNNSSNYINQSQLLSTGLASTYNQILSYLNDKSISISIDYSRFYNFVHFSSAATRVKNFYYKVQLLEQYNSSLTNIQGLTSSSISSSTAYLENKIQEVINGFDNYEYYLYYSSGSNTYPKGNSTPPYNLYYSLSPEALTWYDNQLSTASLYDDYNQDRLMNTIPSYLRNDSQNDQYSLFLDMIGQHYDNIWVYYKDVSNRYKNDNRLNYGISKDLVADALRSFGLKIYQNNFSTNDLFNAFAGYNIAASGSYVAENGNVYVTSSYIDEGQFGYFMDDYVYVSPYNELITNYITASQEAFFQPLDDVNKQIYKRLYHNLPLLLKQKGTVAGLRNLINVYGIPDTILRISEFGGRDRDETTYDYFYERYNYSTNPSDIDSEIFTDWDLNSNWNSVDGVPVCLQFRFKTTSLPTQSLYGIWGLTDGVSTLTAITLRYTGSGYSTSSYESPDSGSKTSPEWQYAILDLIPDVVGNPDTSASLYLPFYDNNWWSVMVNRDKDTSTLTLHAGNKLTYNGYDGNTVGFLASSSVPLDTGWTTSNTSEFITVTSYNTLTGSLQEIRYWTTSSSEDSFKDFIMNPSSIDIFGSENSTYADKLAFRLPLGNELYTGFTSVHPKITGSWAITQSFGSNSMVSKNNTTFTPNIETFFFNSPIAGLRNRITDKIQIVSSSYPPISLEYTQSGNVLTPYQSIQQFPLSQNSETPDVNALEVAFSPTNEIDDDIISSLGYFNIGEYIGDPRQVSSSSPSYPDLSKIRDTYFQKYFANYTLYDYIRLIKFFDNSLFKMIKDFVPARTNLRSGVVVKQHLLERNRYPQPQMEWEDVTYTGSIDTAFISGSTGGTFNEFNTTFSGGSIISNNNGTIDGYNTYKNVFNNGFNITPYGDLVQNSYFTITNNKEVLSNYNNEGVNFKFYINLVAASTYSFKLSSSLQGEIETFSTTTSGLYTPYYYDINNVSISPNETFVVYLSASSFFAGVSNASLSAIFPTATTQVWYETTIGPTGSTQLIHNDQSEFYNGELQGTLIETTNGELNEANIFKYPSTLEINYNTVFYKSDITPLNNFLNINTSPNQGEIYLWFDTGSILNPGQSTPTPGGGGFN